jgi:hypothetical protein
MDEMYRMLGREHEADLEREALKRRRAAELPSRISARRPRRAQRLRRSLARVSVFVHRPARA